MVNGANIPKDVMIFPLNHETPKDFLEKLINSNPEKYQFEDSHSELWMKNGMLRSGSASIYVTGYEHTEYIGSEKCIFSRPQEDTRLITYTYYVAKTYRYIKVIQIPKGASLILPPDEVMAKFNPMGYKPGTYQYGYSAKSERSDNIYDTYHLINEVIEITHTLSGQQIAPDSNPAYCTKRIYTPIQYIFQYQYSTVNWQ